MSSVWQMLCPLCPCKPRLPCCNWELSTFHRNREREESENPTGLNPWPRKPLTNLHNPISHRDTWGGGKKDSAQLPPRSATPGNSSIGSSVVYGTGIITAGLGTTEGHRRRENTLTGTDPSTDAAAALSHGRAFAAPTCPWEGGCRRGLCPPWLRLAPCSGGLACKLPGTRKRGGDGKARRLVQRSLIKKKSVSTASFLAQSKSL